MAMRPMTSHRTTMTRTDMVVVFALLALTVLLVLLARMLGLSLF